MKCGPTRGFASLLCLCLLAAPVLAQPPGPSPDGGQGAPAGEARPVVKLAPAVREASRDAAFFRSLPCEAVDATRPASAREAAWLDERRQACIRQYGGYGRGFLQ